MCRFFVVDHVGDELRLLSMLDALVTSSFLYNMDFPLTDLECQILWVEKLFMFQSVYLSYIKEVYLTSFSLFIFVTLAIKSIKNLEKMKTNIETPICIKNRQLLIWLTLVVLYVRLLFFQFANDLICDYLVELLICIGRFFS